LSYAAWKAATDDAGIATARRRFAAWSSEHVADPTLREDLLILLTRVVGTLAAAGVERVVVDVTMEGDRIDLMVRSQGGAWPEHLAGAVLDAARQASTVLQSDLEVTADTTGFRTTTASLPPDGPLQPETERVLRELRTVSAAALAGLPLHEVLAHLAASARRLVDADVATVVRPDGDDELVVIAADGVLAEELQGMRLSRLGSLAGQVMTTGRIVTVEDAQTDPRTDPAFAWMRFGSSVLVPLWGEGTGVGTLSVAKQVGGGDFDDVAVALLSAFASQASLVVQRADDRNRIEELARVTEREALAEGLREKIITRLFEIGLAVDAARSRVDGAAAERLADVSYDIDQLVADIRKQIFGP
jgi:hypothetical protein